MKPEKIILIRHGESQGNIDKSVYTSIPDHRIELTARGERQARAAGRDLHYHTLKTYRKPSTTGRAHGSVQFECSTHRRSRQTLEHLVSSWNDTGIEGIVNPRPFAVHYDPRLREQEWSGSFAPVDANVTEEVKKLKDERYRYGTYHYRFPNGESGADVYMRVDSFIQALWRDFRKESYPDYLIIVGHGFLNRMFLCRWLHWSPDFFETVDNPPNCGMYTLGLRGDKYALETELQFDPLMAKVEDPHGFA